MVKAKIKKVSTIEGLAGIVQHEFLALRREMATREEAVATREEMREGFRDLHDRIDGLENKFDALEHTLAEVLKAMREDRRETMAELQDLRDRMTRLEKKVGISR